MRLVHAHSQVYLFEMITHKAKQLSNIKVIIILAMEKYRLHLGHLKFFFRKSSNFTYEASLNNYLNIGTIEIRISDTILTQNFSSWFFLIQIWPTACFTTCNILVYTVRYLSPLSLFALVRL